VLFLDDVYTDAANPLTPIDFDTTPAHIGDAIRKVEGEFDVSVNQPSDLSASMVSTFVRDLSARKNIVDSFESSSIQENKHKDIAMQFKALQTSYLNAINAETEPGAAASIMDSYRTHVK
jgi:hypothetical protein